MIFADMQDGHDKRAEMLIQRREEDEGRDEAFVANLNLVGIRRRLNNIEMGIWFAVLLLAAHVYRHW